MLVKYYVLDELFHEAKEKSERKRYNFGTTKTNFDCLIFNKFIFSRSILISLFELAFNCKL